MDLSDLGKTIAKAAPLLGAVLAGPAGATVGAMIAAKFGGNANDPGQLNTLIQADPEAAIKLKQIESEHETQLAQIALADRQSARQRESDLAKAGAKDNTTKILAYVLTVGFMGYIYSLFYGQTNLTAAEHDVAMILVGVLAKSFSDVIGYYFGSSNNANA